MYRRAWAVASLSVSWVFGDTSLTDNGNSSHAFILFIGVVWDFRHRIYMMRNTISALCAATFLCLLCSSCSSSRQVSYLQKLNEEFRDTLIEYDAHIMPKDLLTISVSCSEPEAALPFNLVVPASQTGINSTNLVSQPTLQNYLVNNQGEIVFPVLGTLKVGGMTTQETSELIVGKLERYLKERPIVTVRLVNYKISVIGEVSRPGVYTVNNEQVNVFEAVAMAGDLTIYGKRDNVRIIRTVDGKQNLVTINLNDENIIYSPDFYLRQNDIVYVEPNKAKKQSANIGSSTNLLISITSILISLAGLMVNILR